MKKRPRQFGRTSLLVVIGVAAIREPDHERQWASPRLSLGAEPFLKMWRVLLEGISSSP
jgi:hypothetical protein